RVQIERAGGRRAERIDGIGFRVSLEVVCQDGGVLVYVVVGRDLIDGDTGLLHHIGIACAAVFEGSVADFLDRADSASDLDASSLRSLQGRAGVGLAGDEFAGADVEQGGQALIRVVGIRVVGVEDDDRHALLGKLRHAVADDVRVGRGDAQAVRVGGDCLVKVLGHGGNVVSVRAQPLHVDIEGLARVVHSFDDRY